MLFSSSIAWAQAQRVWVSGVGDDTMPCSRTAPCKTFSGALSKVAAGGEINALDSGGYGAVTIDKSVTIDGQGTLAGVLHSAVVGVTINAPQATVTLRNLSIDGVATGTSGIKIVSAGRVLVENVSIISELAGEGIGIDIAVATPVSVSVRNCSISNALGAGITSRPSGGAPVKLSVDHSRIDQNATGISLFATTTAAVIGSSISQNGAGMVLDSSSSAHVHASTLGQNTIGVAVSGPIAFWGSQIVGNDVAFNPGGPGGVVSTHGNNAIIGNGTLGMTPVLVGLQ